MEAIDSAWQLSRATVAQSRTATFSHVSSAALLKDIADTNEAATVAVAGGKTLPVEVQQHLCQTGHYDALANLAAVMNLDPRVAGRLAKMWPTGMQASSPVTSPTLACDLLKQGQAQYSAGGTAELAVSAVLATPIPTGDDAVDRFQIDTAAGRSRLRPQLLTYWSGYLLWRSDLTEDEIAQCVHNHAFVAPALLHNPHISPAQLRRALRGKDARVYGIDEVTDATKLDVLASHADLRGDPGLAAAVLANPRFPAGHELSEALVDLAAGRSRVRAGVLWQIAAKMPDSDTADRFLRAQRISTLGELTMRCAAAALATTPALVRKCHSETFLMLAPGWAGSLAELVATCVAVRN